jgi:hypothetical protein
MAVLHLSISLSTGTDDLRPGSWADFILKISNMSLPLEQRQFVGRKGLGAGSAVRFSVRFSVPDNFGPKDIEFFQIRHVSHEDFAQTADNWDMNSVTVDIIPASPAPIRLGRGGPHRFMGNTRVLTVKV